MVALQAKLEGREGFFDFVDILKPDSVDPQLLGSLNIFISIIEKETFRGFQIELLQA